MHRQSLECALWTFGFHFLNTGTVVSETEDRHTRISFTGTNIHTSNRGESMEVGVPVEWVVQWERVLVVLLCYGWWSRSSRMAHWWGGLGAHEGRSVVGPLRAVYVQLPQEFHGTVSRTQLVYEYSEIILCIRTSSTSVFQVFSAALIATLCVSGAPMFIYCRF